MTRVDHVISRLLEHGDPATQRVNVDDVRRELQALLCEVTVDGCHDYRPSTRGRQCNVCGHIDRMADNAARGRAEGAWLTRDGKPAVTIRKTDIHIVRRNGRPHVTVDGFKMVPGVKLYVDDELVWVEPALVD